MSIYRIYIDETGNHDMNHAEELNQRFLALTGVIIETTHNMDVIQPDIGTLKRKFFKKDPDVDVILHRKEIINHRPPFDILSNNKICKYFNNDILMLLKKWDYRVITVVIDKLAHREQYTVWHYQPYHYCLTVMLERYVLFLHYGNHKGDVMVESRGGKEDLKLKSSYSSLYEGGNDYIPAERWQERLTSCELKIKPKEANIAGLQVADLIAHPSRREILLENKLIEDDRDIFGNKITEILREDKYLRSKAGKIQGCGTKLLP
jgi:hypothetical protein